MKKLTLLWVDDDQDFGSSIHIRIEDELKDKHILLTRPETLSNGTFVSDTVRDLKPDIIMMDHNLDDVTFNGANLITEIRFQDNETPIIFYSTEMGPRLMRLVEGEHRVTTSPRSDVHSELLRLILSEFTSHL